MKTNKMYRTLSMELFVGEGKNVEPTVEFKEIFIGAEKRTVLVPKRVDLSPVESATGKIETDVINAPVAGNRLFRMKGQTLEGETYGTAFSFLTVNASNRQPDNIEHDMIVDFACMNGITIFGRDLVKATDKANPKTIYTFVPVIVSASQTRTGKYRATLDTVDFKEFVSDVTYGCKDICDGKTKVIPKESARVSLSTSSSTIAEGFSSSFAVIEDFTRDLEFKAYVYDIKTRSVKKEIIKDSFEQHDGMGVIDIRKARELAKALGMKRVPSAFQIRFASCKGLLVVMDIKKFTNNRIEEDILFPNSMWKKDFDLSQNPEFSVCLTSTLASQYANLNYQFLQAFPELKFSDFEKACLQPQIDRLERLTTSPEDLKVFLGMIANRSDETDIEDSDIATQLSLALSRNSNIMSEPRFQRKIRELSEKFIKDMAMGRVPIKGSYTLLTMDPTCIFEGLRINDTIKAKDFNKAGYLDTPQGREYKYSRVGNGEFVADQKYVSVLKSGESYYKGEVGQHLGMRPPLTHPNQVGHFNCVSKETLPKFVYDSVYKYLDDVIVFSSYDNTHLGMSGASL